MLPRRLILVRHGESEGNIAAQAIKKGDDYSHMKRIAHVHTEAWRLTERGRAQAVCAGKYIRELPHSTLWSEEVSYRSLGYPEPLAGYTSPFARAMETAALLNLSLGPEMGWRIHPMLAERNWGMASATTEEERKLLLPSLDLRDRDGLWWAPPGGESVASVTVRLHAFLDGISRDSNGANTTVVVCHGEVMWALRILLERMPPHEYRELDESSDPAHKIHNAHILVYEKPRGCQGYTQRLSVCPWSEEEGQIVPKAREATELIQRPTYSNADLLALLDKHYPPLLR
jgi:NAD+ kinase